LPLAVPLPRACVGQTGVCDAVRILASDAYDLGGPREPCSAVLRGPALTDLVHRRAEAPSARRSLVAWTTSLSAGLPSRPAHARSAPAIPGPRNADWAAVGLTVVNVAGLALYRVKALARFGAASGTRSTVSQVPECGCSVRGKRSLLSTNRRSALDRTGPVSPKSLDCTSGFLKSSLVLLLTSRPLRDAGPIRADGLV
jgi:hypothetical protein